jgi:outer membrane protein OmpA-like peptidoglycan-associated protein
MYPNESKFVPYVTGGVGGVHPKYDDAEAPVKLAWNAGAGFTVWFTEQIGLRVDGRDVSYKVPNPSTGENKFRHSPEIFAGITIGFGGRGGDEDRDGVTDKLDQCPGTPAGARVDANGCPIDSDGDGVPDGIDQCENTPKGATVDALGCPADADKDGVFDGLDQCPDTPAGTMVDARGCPLDADGDGVPDGIDQCANTPIGCSVDAKGCPMDDDGDGVCNGVDTCPDTPANARVDTKGCPILVSEKETELLDTGMIRLHNVNFDTDKATIKPESYAVLNEVGEILTRWPELKIEIGGHADWRGSDAYNLRLSQARSASVLAYLREKFPALKADQYTAVGYGERVPIADNKTELGMAKNRRVEFKVLNTEVLKRVREERKVVPK